jgi:hypothetical protein
MKRMSKELAAMLKASEVARKSRRNLDVTHTQQVLEFVANRMIRKADGRKAKVVFNPQIPAEQCGTNGLRPTWHGRAS